MFVVTIGPLSRQWVKVVKILALVLVVVLAAVIVRHYIVSMSEPQYDAGPSEVDAIGAEVVAMVQRHGTSFWNRFLYGLQQWFQYGF